MNKTKELKQKVLMSNEGFISICEKTIVPLLKQINKTGEKLDALIHKALDKNLFPEAVHQEWEKIKYEKLKKGSNDWQEKRDKVKWYRAASKLIVDPAVANKCQKLYKELSRLFQEVKNQERQIEEEYHVIFRGDSKDGLTTPLAPVNYLALTDGENQTISGIVPADNIKLPEFIKTVVERNGVLNIQIDLMYDKKDITQAVDDIVALAQKHFGLEMIRGKHKSVEKSQQELLILNIFLFFYLSPNTTIEKALEDTTSILQDCYNIMISEDSIKRRYLPRIREIFEVKDIREFKKAKKEKRDK